MRVKKIVTILYQIISERRFLIQGRFYTHKVFLRVDSPFECVKFKFSRCCIIYFTGNHYCTIMNIEHFAAQTWLHINILNKEHEFRDKLCLGSCRLLLSD